MSGAHLSYILYPRLFLVRGLVITVRRLIITDTNVCVTLSRQVCHSMTSSSSLKISNCFTFFSLFQQVDGQQIVSTMMRSLAVALPLIVAAGAFSVPPAGVPIIVLSSVPRDLILLPRLLSTRLRASDAVVDYGGGEGEDEEDDDDEEAEPGTMRVSEIKAELEIRGVRFLDCFDKESLAARLLEARATGKADPSIIDNFNKQKVRQSVGRLVIIFGGGRKPAAHSGAHLNCGRGGASLRSRRPP